MQYYCNICRKTITTDEFYYSLDKFGKPLCKEHQDLYRQTNTQKIEEPVKEIPLEPPQQTNTETTEEISTSKKLGKLIKQVAVATGKGILKGAKKLADGTKKRIQIRRWKDDILRRMNKQQIIRLCYEKRIATKTNYLKELPMKKDDLMPTFETRTRKSTFEEMASRIKNHVDLDDIISFAKRNHINIRDILADIYNKKAEWKVKEITEIMKEGEVSLILEIEKAIIEFKPLRKYDKEIFYQDSLASWLKSKFPETDIEISRGSTRPDIVVEGIAIEVKGPTFEKDLQTISDKCMRYCQYFPQGLICVLFSVYVNNQRYKDWKKGMEKTFPDVKIIRIQ